MRTNCLKNQPRSRRAARVSAWPVVRSVVDIESVRVVSERVVSERVVVPAAFERVVVSVALLPVDGEVVPVAPVDGLVVEPWPIVLSRVVPVVLPVVEPVVPVALLPLGGVVEVGGALPGPCVCVSLVLLVPPPLVPAPAAPPPA